MGDEFSACRSVVAAYTSFRPKVVSDGFRGRRRWRSGRGS